MPATSPSCSTVVYIWSKGDTREAWKKFKERYESNTGTELLVLYKEYISLKLKDIKEDPETFIANLDELQSRMKEDPFNEEISNNSFMIHLLNSLPVEYESVVESMENHLAL